MINKTPPLKIIELFAGIGSQTEAFQRIEKEILQPVHEVVATAEIDKFSNQSYELLHNEVNNLGDITKIERLPKADLIFYSFPCQAISFAGKQQGFDKGSGTESSLLWEVERLLNTAKDNNELPTYLVMENVKALISKTFIKDYEVWLSTLEQLGYTNYWQVLNAKDYGIAQSRERVFAVSILNSDTPFNFPQPFELQTRIKDYLDSEVDEKYYLNPQQLGKIASTKFSMQGIGRIKTPDEVLQTNTAFSGGGHEPKVKVEEKFISYALSSREHKAQGWKDVSPTLAARDYKDPKVILEPCSIRSRHNKETGELEPNLEIRTDGISNCLPSFTKDSRVKEYSSASVDKIIANIVELDGVSNTITANPQRPTIDSGTLIKVYDNKGYIELEGELFRIRKLTPREAWRLMGWEDNRIDLVEGSLSNSQLYKQAGNSIVVDVLYYLFKEVLKHWEDKNKGV